jgi:hypothetical protein
MNVNSGRVEEEMEVDISTSFPYNQDQLDLFLHDRLSGNPYFCVTMSVS